jgi:hypothetical protein
MQSALPSSFWQIRFARVVFEASFTEMQGCWNRSTDVLLARLNVSLKCEVCRFVVPCWTVCRNFADEQRERERECCHNPDSLWRLYFWGILMYWECYCLLKAENCIKTVDILTGKFYFFPSIMRDPHRLPIQWSTLMNYSPWGITLDHSFTEYGRHELNKNLLQTAV